ncbi:MAG: diguanylate cyclase, partial [Hyphomicrobiales bacterium]|nr:diguanylate cyclase [Hyphomicrobiales bacterium]
MAERTFTSESDELPEDGRDGLLKSLFAEWQSMMLGCLMTGLSAVAVALLMRDWAANAATAAIVAVAAIRVLLLKDHRAAARSLDEGDIRRLETQYVIAVCAYLLAIGALTAIATTCSSDPFVLVVVTAMWATNAVAIAVRNFAVEKGVGWQITAAATPLACAFLVRGGLFPFLVPILVGPVCAFIQSSAARLRNTFLSEMSYRRRSESIAAQFDFAINNMSHGMCMISADRLVLVSNAKFAEFFGMAPGASLAHVDFASLLSQAIERGAIARENADKLLDLVMTPKADADQCDVQIEMVGGRVYDVTLTRHDNGSCVIVVQDVTEKREAERAIDHMARFDSVTNLRNRRSFETALADTLATARASGARTEVLFIDLDRFKQVNDTLGHKVGDKALVIAGDRLCAIAGKDDFIARWGGDEFVILRSRL